MHLLEERLKALSEAEHEVSAARRSDAGSAPMEVVRTGRAALVEAAQHILSLETALTASERVLSDLEVRAEAIRRVVTLIDDVAGETHLLALNAKILAAQAGQEGAGFSVVATKLMDLAGNTRRATGEVAEILGALAEESVRSGATVRGSVEKVREGARLADRANDAFDALAQIVSDHAKEARRLGNRLDTLKQRREEVEDAVMGLLGKLD